MSIDNDKNFTRALLNFRLEVSEGVMSSSNNFNFLIDVLDDLIFFICFRALLVGDLVLAAHHYFP